MLRFNDKYLFYILIFWRFQYILCYGSTGMVSLDSFVCVLFQYILCYGSTFWLFVLVLGFQNFNTSYVTVQPSLVRLFIDIAIISIHPMLRFNDPEVISGVSRDINFNTSYVTVQLFFWLLELELSYHFNTSYVTVQQGKGWRFFARFLRFQYILCYGSTLMETYF